MTSSKDKVTESPEVSSREPLPASKRVYLSGKKHPFLRVPLREVTLSPTKSFSGELEENEPVRLYDCSGPWGDPDFKGEVTEGLPALRAEWITGRDDVEPYEGRDLQPMDNGYLSEKHAAYASNAERNRLVKFPGLKSKG